MDDLECLICSEPRAPISGNNNFVSVRAQQIEILRQLFQDNQQGTCDLTPCAEDNVLCCSCEGKVNQAQDMLQKLQELQRRLEELRTDIKSCVEEARRAEPPSAKNYRLRSWRDKIMSGFQGRTNNAERDIEGVHISIKEEAADVEMPVLSPSLPIFDDDFNSADLSNPASPVPISYEPVIHQTDSFSGSKRIVQELRIELQRIDELYPALRYATTINLAASAPVLKIEVDDADDDQNFMPQDTSGCFDVEKYTFPSRCGVPDCKSLKRFAKSKSLIRHFRDVHKHKISSRVQLDRQLLYSIEENFLKTALRADIQPEPTNLPNEDPSAQVPKTFDDIQLDENKYKEFPTACKEPGCKSKSCCFTKRKLKRHIFCFHIGRPQKRRPKQIWEECTFPTRCPYPNCKQNKLFHRKVVLRTHIYRIHQSGRQEDPFAKFTYPTSCPIEGCKSERQFANKTRLRFHVKSVHRRKLGLEEGFISTGSGAASSTSAALSEQIIMCEVCGVVVLNEKSLETHMRGHTGQLLECDKCDAKFRSKAGLVQHSRAHHSGVVFQCQYCPKTFKVKQLLKVHTWRHTGHKKKVCEICSQAFMFKVLLDEHKRFVHYEELGLEPFRCTICNKIFSRPKYLEEHMKTHTGGGRFSCSQCPYNTDRGKDLQEHVSTVHCSEFPYICNQCGKRFKLERRLVEHEKYHEDDYPFQCTICKRKCASGRTLALHLRRKHAKTDLGEQTEAFNPVTYNWLSADLRE